MCSASQYKDYYFLSCLDCQQGDKMAAHNRNRTNQRIENKTFFDYFEFQQQLQELDNGVVVYPNSIVTYIIPPNTNIHKLRAHVKQEIV